LVSYISFMGGKRLILCDDQWSIYLLKRREHNGSHK
jgi:hypothetical protein